MSDYLCRYCDKKVLIFLDEYDTPMQEAYMHGYWEEMVEFIGTLFHATFKTNTSMERAIMIGITRISKESIFSDLNHLQVVTTTKQIFIIPGLYSITSIREKQALTGRILAPIALQGNWCGKGARALRNLLKNCSAGKLFIRR